MPSLITRILSDEEFKIELIKKLKEEFTELEEAISLNDKNKIKEETADLLEVVKTYNELVDNSFGDVITTMVEKREKRGGFTRKLFLERVEK